MKNKLMRCLLIRFASLSLLSTSFMLTQDDLSAFYDEVDKLIDSGVSKEEIINYDLCPADIPLAEYVKNI